MKGPIAIKADILKTFIQEDRNEIRAIRDRVHSITSSILVASFAITAFLFGKDNDKLVKGADTYSTLVDVLLVCLIIISFLMLKRQLVHARKAIRLRQNLLINLTDDDQADLNPFDNAERETPDISDNDLVWVIGLAVAMLIVKAIIVAKLFCS